MYRIVQLGSQWIVCVGPAMLLAFERMDAAVKTIADAEKLIGADGAPDPSPLPGFAVRIAAAIQRCQTTMPQVEAASAFVERRRASRAVRPAEMDAAE